MQKQDSNISYPALLPRETYTRQVSQQQVANKDCPGTALVGVEKAEAGQGMDTHLEIINSSPSAAQANWPITDRPETFKTPD